MELVDIIDEIRLTSLILAVQLEAVHRVFPFVVTCGRKVAGWAAKKTNLLERFWVETILNEFLIGAIGFVWRAVQKKIVIEYTILLERLSKPI